MSSVPSHLSVISAINSAPPVFQDKPRSLPSADRSRRRSSFIWRRICAPRCPPDYPQCVPRARSRLSHPQNPRGIRGRLTRSAAGRQRRAEPGHPSPAPPDSQLCLAHFFLFVRYCWHDSDMMLWMGRIHESEEEANGVMCSVLPTCFQRLR